MKRSLLFLIAILLISPYVMAGGKKKKTTQATAAVDSNEIHWMTLDQVQDAMKKAPKKVYMDVYTDWCGWCKVMEKKTFTNKNVIRYMNEKFYAVRLNAEQKDSIRFMGKTYGYMPDNRANQFAIELMRGQMSYPTSIIFEENFNAPQPIPGYLDVSNMEMVLKYLGENLYKTVPFQQYQQEFKGSWQSN